MSHHLISVTAGNSPQASDLVSTVQQQDIHSASSTIADAYSDEQQSQIPHVIHSRNRRMVSEEQQAAISTIPEEFRNLGQGEVRTWAHPQTGEALKVVRILNENNRIVAIKLKSRTANTYVEVDWQSGTASKKIISEDAGVYLRSGRGEKSGFSTLTRPFAERMGSSGTDFPVWDTNIPIKRDPDLLNMLVGEGKLYREGPTGFLIRKGRKGEFVYRAHKGPPVQAMARSHGVGHWSDTFGDGSGGSSVIAAGSTIRLAKLYQNEFIRVHGENPSNIRLYMIDVEGLDVAYVDESIALNFDLPADDRNAQDFVERLTNGWDGVAPTEVHVRGPIPKGRVTDITNMIPVAEGSDSTVTATSLGYTRAGRFLVGSSEETSTSNSIHSDRQLLSPAPVSAIPRPSSASQRFVAQPRQFLTSLQSAVKRDVDVLTARIPSGPSPDASKISQTIFYMPSININSVASSDYWDERLLSLVQEKVRRENLPLAEMQRYDSEYFYGFYHPSTKKLILAPKADLAYDFNSLLNNGDLLETAQGIIADSPRTNSEAFSGFLNDMLRNGRIALKPRAVVIMVPENVLKTEERNEFRHAIENLRQRHPTIEIYALSQAENGQWKNWKFDETIQGSEWQKNWIALETSLQGEYEKITAIWHGQQKFDLIEESNNRIAAEKISDFVRDVRQVERLSIVACGKKPQLGTLLYQKLTEKGVVVQRIIGSEHNAYIAGNREGNRNRELNHGTWQVERLGDGNLKTTQFVGWEVERGEDGKWKTVQAGNAAPPAPDDAGPFAHAKIASSEDPFDIIRQLQAASSSAADVKAGAAAYDYAQEVQEESRAEEKIRNLGRDFSEAQRMVLTKAGKQSPWILLPNTIEKGSNGAIKATIYNTSNHQHDTVSITEGEDQKRLENLKKTYNEEMENLRRFKPYLGRDTQGNIILKAGALDTIRALSQTRGGKAILGFSSGIFGTRAWASYFMKQNTESPMPLGLQIAAYWNLADATAGMSDDAVRLAKFAVQKFAREGATITQGAVKVLRGVGNTFKAVNVGLTVGSIAFDIYQLATAEDEQTRIQAGVSLGTTLASLGVAFAAGPLAALPVALLGLLISYIIQAIFERQNQISQTLDSLVSLDQLLEKGGYEVRDGVLWFDNIAIKKVDFPNGKIVFDSHKIRAIHEMDTNWQERPYGNLREGLGYPAEKRLNLPQIPRIRVLPSGTNKYSYDYVINSCATSHTASEQQKRVWQTLANNRAIQRPASGIGSGNQIHCAPRSKERTHPEEIPFEVILDEGESTYFIPEKAGENLASYKFQTNSKGGNIFITGLQPGIKLSLRDLENAEKPSLFRIQVSTPVDTLNGANPAVNIIHRDQKKFVRIQYRDGKSSEIDITGLAKSSLQILIKEEAEQNGRITGKIVSLEINPESTSPTIKEPHFIGYNHIETQSQLRGRGLKHRTKIFLEPAQPKPPPATKAEESRDRIHGTIPTKYHVTKITTTAQTKTTENYIATEDGTEIESTREPRHVTVPTPKDDQYFKDRENYFKALNENRAKIVTTFWDAEKESVVWFDELNSGIFTQAIDTNGSSVFYYQPAIGKVFDVEMQSSSHSQATHQLPIVHKKSFIGGLIKNGNSLFLEQVIPSGEKDQNLVTIAYEIEGQRIRIRQAGGLSEAQLAQLMRSISTMGFAEALTRLLGGEISAGEVTPTNYLKVSVTGERGPKQYAITKTGAKILLSEGEEIVGELIKGSERMLILHSAEKKTAKFVKLLNDGGHTITETAAQIKKVFIGEKAFMVKEEGEKVISYDPFIRAMRTTTVPAMAEGWEKITNLDGTTHFFHLRTKKSIPAERDSQLLLGTISSGEEKYLLWSPSTKLAQIITVKMPGEGQPVTSDLPDPVIITPLLNGQSFTKPLNLVVEEDHSFSLIAGDGKRIYKINDQGHLFLHAEVEVLFYSLQSRERTTPQNQNSNGRNRQRTSGQETSADAANQRRRMLAA